MFFFEKLEDRNLLAAFEFFDGVTAPTLPVSWTQSTTSTNPWTTVAGANSDSAPNHAFVANLASVSDSILTSTSFFLSPTASILSFRQNYDTEQFWDGGVLEISVNGGVFRDIVTAGGVFSSGGYVGALNASGNPIAGRQTWNGSSGGYMTTVVSLPATALNQNVRLRWRFGSDESVPATGWRIDSISLNAPPTEDFGDAPSPYPVTLAQDGARHTPGSLFLGATVDIEADGIPSLTADADGADEDGVSFPNALSAGGSANFQVIASQNGGLLNGWIDWNADGDWIDSGEQVFTNQSVSAGANSLSVSIPSTALPGTKAARFRLSTASGISFTGLAANGEVEDYLVSVITPGAWVDQGPAPTINGQLETNTQPNRRVTGAIHTVLAHPTNPDIVYIGAVNGGIWKTTNATALLPIWTPQTDSQQSLAIGAMAFDPTDATQNTLVAGTAKYSSFASFGGTRGAVYRTTDGGATWTAPASIGITGENISGIAARGSTIVVTSSGNSGGVFRSTNGGATFAPISSADFTSPLHDFSDLVEDPSDPTGQRLYVASVGVGGSGGIYRSDNFGSSWERISSAAINSAMHSLVLTTNNIEMAVHPSTGRLYVATLVSGQPRGLFHTNNGTSASPTWTQMDVPVLPIGSGVALTEASNTTPIQITSDAHGLSTGNFVVIAGVTGNTAANGFFRVTVIDANTFSLDTSVGDGDYAGEGTWTRVTGPNPTPKDIDKSGGQGRIHFSIVVDPTNEDIVYVGGDRQEQPNSIGDNTFGGAIFRGDANIARNPTVVPSPQWDHITHDIVAFDPPGGTANGTATHADSREMAFDANGNLLETDDGGIYRRTNPRSNTGDWFSMAGTLGVIEFHDVAYDSLSNVLIGGTQDNGTHFQVASGNKVWDFLSGGDGGDVAVDNVTLAGSNQSIRYSSSQNLGGFRRTVWGAGNNLISSTNPARTVLSGAVFDPAFKTPVELNAVNPQRMLIIGDNGIYESLNSGSSMTQISTVALGSLQDAVDYGGFQSGVPNPDVFYAGMGDDILVRTTAGGAVSAVDPDAASTANIRDVVMHSNDWTTAFAVDNNQVFRSITSGASWTDITGNLMSLAGEALQTIEFVSGTVGALVVGGNLGVFVSLLSSLGVWTEVGAGLPNAMVYDLKYNATDDVLAAGTLGRGVWTLPDASTTLNPVVDITPPVILDVKVSASTWVTSFLNIVDPGVGLGYPIPDGTGQQLIALPWNNIDRIHVLFSENVGATFTQANLVISGLNVANYNALIAPSGVTYNSSTNVGTIVFTQAISTDKLRLTISDNVTDGTGNRLDGEWVDNSSTGASGNGTAGGAFAYRINVLPGDISGEGVVLGNDVTSVVNSRGTLVGGLGYNPRTDQDGSGVVLGNDVTSVVNRRLTSLPINEPLAPPIPIAKDSMRSVLPESDSNGRLLASDSTEPLEVNSDDQDQTLDPSELESIDEYALDSNADEESTELSSDVLSEDDILSTDAALSELFQ